MIRKAKETAHSIYGEAEKLDYGERRKELARHAIKSESNERIKAMSALTQDEPGIPVRPDALDAYKWLLNVKNGTVNLKTGELRPHDRKDRITKMALVEYEPDAKAPTFEAFLECVLLSEGLRGFVQRTADLKYARPSRQS